MKITVMGVVILIGSILLLAIAVEHLNRKLNENSKPTQDRGSDEQTTLQASDWLTASEAAAYLRVKVRTLLLWTRQGKVKAYTLSGTQRHVWRFRTCDLDAMLVGPSVPCSKGAQ